MSAPLSSDPRTEGYLYAQRSAEEYADNEILVRSRAQSGKPEDEADAYAFLFGYQVARLPGLPVKVTPLQKKIMERIDEDCARGEWSTLETLTEQLPLYYTKKDIQAAIDACPLISYAPDGMITRCPDQADRSWMEKNSFIIYL